MSEQQLLGAGRLSLRENNYESKTNNIASLSFPLPGSSNSTFKWVEKNDDKTHEWLIVPTNNNDNSNYCYNDENNYDFNRNNSSINMIAHVFEHIVLPNDTFSGLCLQYKTTSTKIRQYNNGFSGASLSNAPAKLYIPVTNRNRSKVKIQNRKSKEFLEHLILAEVPGLSSTNLARDHLDNNNWDVHLAIQQSKLYIAQKEQKHIKAVQADAEAEAVRKSKKKLKQRLQKNFRCSSNDDNNNNAVDAFHDLLRSLFVDDDSTSNGMQKQRHTMEFEMSPTNFRCPSLHSLSSSSLSSTTSSSNSSLEEDCVVDILAPTSSSPFSGHVLRERGMRKRIKEIKELECLLNCEQQKTTTPLIQNNVRNAVTIISTTGTNKSNNFKTKMPREMPSLSARQAFYDNGNEL